MFTLERKADQALHQRGSEYEQQIKEYQDNLEQASRETENIRIELAEVQEEKASIEKISHDTIESLKQDFEKQNEILKTELQDRGLMIVSSLITISFLK
jgi:multidrug resistance efflux pump